MRILIVDDHPLFREALGSLLEQLYHGASIFTVATTAEAVSILNQYTPFQLIILDIALPDTEGVDAFNLLQNKSHNTPIVVMSCVHDVKQVQALINLGVRGYITKSATGGEVKNALHLIAAGEIYISPCMLATLKANSTKKDHVPMPMDIDNTPCAMKNDLQLLTSRQQQVFQLMAQGLPNKLIASHLKCSDGTVKLHVSAILKALHARNRTEAVNFFIKTERYKSND